VLTRGGVEIARGRRAVADRAAGAASLAARASDLARGREDAGLSRLEHVAEDML